jgi:hypothetical protein
VEQPGYDEAAGQALVKAMVCMSPLAMGTFGGAGGVQGRGRRGAGPGQEGFKSDLHQIFLEDAHAKLPLFISIVKEEHRAAPGFAAVVVAYPVALPPFLGRLSSARGALHEPGSFRYDPPCFV